MVVVPRATSISGDGTQITSPKVATSTAIGMVLGILCLFGMILSYQLLACPCKRRKARPAQRKPLPVITTLHPPSKPKRSFRNCFGHVKSKPKPRSPFLKNPLSLSSEKDAGASPAPLKESRNGLRSFFLFGTRRGAHSAPATQTASTSEPKPTLRERRALRSIYLNTSLPSPRKRYPPGTPSPISPALKRMGRVFQFDSSTPPDTPTISPLFSARTPRTPTSRGRRQYQQLDDSYPYTPTPTKSKLSAECQWANEATDRTKQPQDALISPWSPDEGEYPYYPYSPAGPKSLSFALAMGELSPVPYTPPPLYPPPPAYLPEIPLRGPGSTPATPTRSQTSPVPPSRPPGAQASRSATRSPSFSASEAPEPLPVTRPRAVPVSPIVLASLREEIDGDIGSWEFAQVREALANHAAAVAAHGDDPFADPVPVASDPGVFVISNSSEDGHSSCADSDLDTLSIHTDDSVESLTLHVV
ncbi:hypothetical protein C8Q80DRAFT_1266121 [Daedaleopsis nitida]|nr:hypothetical protein C8Q80DRAFT_1266121 [Daedaleopsis nitida]